jgi:hypothetical protein
LATTFCECAIVRHRHLFPPISSKSIARNSYQFPSRSWTQKPGCLRNSLL